MTTSDLSAAFKTVVQRRHSVRQFLSKPVPTEVIRSVLEDAHTSPSNRNTQPWQVHVLSGPVVQEFSRRMIEAANKGERSADFSWDGAAYQGVYAERSFEHGAVRNAAMGIARDDLASRHREDFRNLEMFGAPHVALLFMPSVGDNARVAGDIGMYGQTLLLSLVAHGLGGIPQTSLGLHAGIARDLLGIEHEMKLLFGVAFGYEDVDSISNSYRMPKSELRSSVVMHDSLR